MWLTIHRGAEQIGGSCLEIEYESKRLIIDLGLPLDAGLKETPLPAVKGLVDYTPDLLGLVISHAHLDHYGLMAKISPHVPVLIGEGASRILAASKTLFSDTKEIEQQHTLQHNRTIQLGPFTITPYLVDHSAYDAYGLTVDAGGKRVFYSGDFRAHGRKDKLFEKLVSDPPKNIDVMLMEGSTIGRADEGNRYPSEQQLETCFIDIFKRMNGLSLVWASGQNIDRLVTLYKACRKSGKKLVIDMYTANILRSIGNPRLPQPGWRDLFVFLPQFQRRIIKERKLFTLAKSFAHCRIFPERLRKMGGDAVMLFRPSMARDIEQAECIGNAVLIYSLWPGYLREKRLQWFLEWLESNRIPLEHCHTSGHASVGDLKRFASAMKPKRLVPIHTFEPAAYRDLFENVELRGDGERWEV